jgi:hypothetical protein
MFFREIGWSLSFVYFLFGWRAGTASLPPGDIIFAHRACHLEYLTYPTINIGQNYQHPSQGTLTEGEGSAQLTSFIRLFCKKVYNVCIIKSS